MDRWYSSSQSPIKFEACRTSSRGRLFPFLDFSSQKYFGGRSPLPADNTLGFPGARQFKSSRRRQPKSGRCRSHFRYV
ncbi:Hypothetical protein AT6N2_L0541 [Agrobacterium tumefaciens]|nr:Hypothetical protein AT6N2_L0541 [Agrobacterium tumefaciens]